MVGEEDPASSLRGVDSERGLGHGVGAGFVAAAQREVDAYPLGARGEARDRTEQALERRAGAGSIRSRPRRSQRPGEERGDDDPSEDPHPQTHRAAQAEPVQLLSPTAARARPTSASSVPTAKARESSAAGTRPIPTIESASHRSAPGSHLGAMSPSQAGIHAARIASDAIEGLTHAASPSARAVHAANATRIRIRISTPAARSLAHGLQTSTASERTTAVVPGDAQESSNPIAPLPGGSSTSIEPCEEIRARPVRSSRSRFARNRISPAEPAPETNPIWTRARAPAIAEVSGAVQASGPREPIRALDENAPEGSAR